MRASRRFNPRIHEGSYRNAGKPFLYETVRVVGLPLRSSDGVCQKLGGLVEALLEIESDAGVVDALGYGHVGAFVIEEGDHVEAGDLIGHFENGDTLDFSNFFCTPMDDGVDLVAFLQFADSSRMRKADLDGYGGAYGWTNVAEFDKTEEIDRATILSEGDPIFM